MIQGISRYTLPPSLAPPSPIYPLEGNSYSCIIVSSQPQRSFFFSPPHSFANANSAWIDPFSPSVNVPRCEFRERYRDRLEINCLSHEVDLLRRANSIRLPASCYVAFRCLVSEPFNSANVRQSRGGRPTYLTRPRVFHDDAYVASFNSPTVVHFRG